MTRSFICLFILVISQIVYDQAQAVTFEKKVILLQKHKIVVEIADTEARRSQGLMNRTDLSENHGMLFVFPKEQILSFWIKNTFVPLSIGFFDKNQVLLEIQDMKVEPLGSLVFPNYVSKQPAKFALEVPFGFFKTKSIQIGTKFDFL